MKLRTIETTVPATVDPELGERRCPNGHNSALRPRLPEVMFHACGHYRPTVSGTSSALRVVSDMRRLVSTGTLIAWIVPCTTASTTCRYCGAKMRGGL